MPDLPDTLASSAARPPGVRAARHPRARSNIPGVRAETLYEGKRGERLFRLAPDNAALRAYGRKRGFRVSSHGPVPRAVRAAYHKENAWTVRIISLRAPGDSRYRQYYVVMQGQYERKQTRDPFYVQRVLGTELFAQLKEEET